MEVDLSLVGVSLGDVVERTERLRALGASGVFTAEGPHDVFLPLGLASTVPGCALLTNAAIAFPRNPIHVAHAAWDLHDASGGRFRLGLAPQVQRHIERRFGLEWSEPVARMADLVGAIRAVFASWQDGVPLDYQGRFHHHSLMTPVFSPAPLSVGVPPVLLGAQGPRMAEMAGSVADGLLVLPFHSERSLSTVTLPAVDRGLATRGRTRAGFEVVCGVIVGVGADAASLDRAREAVRGLLGFYGSTPAYASVLEVEGLSSLHGTLRAAVREGRWGELGSLVPDELVEVVAIVGSPASCARALLDRFGGVADRLALFLPYDCDDETLGTLLERIHEGASPR